MSTQTRPIQPSQLQTIPERFNQLHGAANADNYETVLAQLIGQLSLDDIQGLERIQRERERSRTQLTDREIAYGLFLENAREVITFNNDRAIAQRLFNEQQNNARVNIQPANATRARAAEPPQNLNNVHNRQ
ncbi:hypothetical protein SERLA73DRAFT_174808, partial [Serpula lacrymans var. lacrymans S7.3]